MNIKTLSISTGVLFIIALTVFVFENRRGTDLVAGSDFIKGMDAEKIHKISLSFSGDKNIVLVRDSEHFVLENHKSYPAATEKVNNLIYKIASIQVKEKVSGGPSEVAKEKFGLNKSSRKFFVEVFDGEDKRTVAFTVGNASKGGRGNYLYKEDGKAVYLSGDSLLLNSSYKDFIDTVLLKVNEKKIEKITVKGRSDIEFEKEGEKYIIATPKVKKYKEEKVKQYFHSFRVIRFQDYFSSADPEVAGLNFSDEIKVNLENQIRYQLSLAKRKDKHFLKVSALADSMPRRVVVKRDDSKEDLEKIEAMAKAQDRAQRFNLMRGTWVYKIDEKTYTKLVKDKAEFL